MIIKTELLRKFLQEVSLIKPNVLFPALNVIKIQYSDGQINLTKTNQNIFCNYTTEDTGFNIDDEIFVINEKALNGVIQTTESDTLTITRKDDALVTIKGSGMKKIELPFEDPKGFPIMPIVKDESVEIDSESLFCIRVASKYIYRGPRITAQNFVGIDENGIFGTDGIIVYHNGIQGLPKIFLSEDVLPILRPISGMVYCHSDSYDFFIFDGFEYAFLKPVIEKGVPYKNIIDQTGPVIFHIERDKLLKFCTLVEYVTKETIATCSLEYNGNELFLNYDDVNFNIHANEQILCPGEASCDEFKFSLSIFMTLLKSLPYTMLTFTQIGPHFKITSPEDEKYTGIIGKLD